MNDSERYRKIFLFFLSFKWCSQNEFVSQCTCLQPHLYVKIQAPENDDEQHFN